MRFTTLLYRNIVRRKTRSALTISGIAVAVGAVVALVGIVQAFQNSLLTLYEERGVDLIAVRAGGVQRMGSTLDEAIGAKIRQQPGVRDVTAGLVEVVSFEEMDLFGVLVRGLSDDSFMLEDMKIISGRQLAPDDTRVVMLGKVLAKNLQKKVHDTIEVFEDEPFEVVGIYESFTIFENGSMVMPLAELQRLMDRQDEVTAFLIVAEYSDAESLEDLQQRIADLAPNLEVLPARELVDSAIELRMARAVAWMTSTVALLVGTIGMINTMLTAVFERTRELAVLRAIGWRKWSVMKMILCESIVLALIGAVVGTLAAIGLTQLLGTLPISERLVAGGIAPEVVLQGFAVALFVGVAGGLYPAFRAARLVPTEGLHHE